MPPKYNACITISAFCSPYDSPQSRDVSSDVENVRLGGVHSVWARLLSWKPPNFWKPLWKPLWKLLEKCWKPFFILKKRKGMGILFFNIIRIPWFPTLSQQFPQRFPQRFPGFHVCVRFPQDDLGTPEYNVEGVGWCSASDGSIEMHLMAPKYNA